ncbi:MAG: DUF697 domain-containing protein [Jaaginema sp. PMC 1079.18]|nr:DUF697 domain-containing protein [Jaaginema sp. PMC 1080.18]MEC4850362.1 DUF697 domain-containing protein [Jaaginema sp. PMC 1079.18]MEC4867160.1 DUF697 domain-containing protein [Jaaginema sp. PMC 1078.18]
MAVKIRKPILVGGLGLSFGLWAWWNLQDSLLQAGETGLTGVMIVGGGLWLLQRAKPRKTLSLPQPQAVTEAMLNRAIAKVQELIKLIATEAPDTDVSDLEGEIEGIRDRLQRQTIQLAIAGGRKTGKTELATQLKGEFSPETLEIIDTEALFSNTETADSETEKAILATDLVIFLLDGDLADSELQKIQQWRSRNQQVLVCLNKQDRYPDDEKATILEQVKANLVNLVDFEDISVIATQPAPIKVRKHQEDGTVSESLEAQKPEIVVLRDRVSHLLENQRQALVLATAWREAINLQTAAKTRLNAHRRSRALPIIERYQWIAATAAFANPVAALDLLAAAAISTQMLVDLGEIYQQKFSLSQAQNASGTLGEQMVKLGLVELSTQTIGGLLKSHAVTYVAGGVVQGISAAYLTRIAGLSLIEYLEDQDIQAQTEAKINWDKFSQILQNVFQANQRTAFLKNFVPQAQKRLVSN